MSSQPNKRPQSPADNTSELAQLLGQSQVDFEIDFFNAILARHPDYVDVLRVQANNLSIKKRYHEGIAIDKRLIALRPKDPLVWYNLACSYALLRQVDMALSTLKRAIEIGYRDFRYIRQDRDLDAIRGDPRFRRLLSEFENR